MYILPSIPSFVAKQQQSSRMAKGRSRRLQRSDDCWRSLARYRSMEASSMTIGSAIKLGLKKKAEEKSFRANF
jgi:hypothetical protein